MIVKELFFFGFCYGFNICLSENWGFGCLTLFKCISWRSICGFDSQDMETLQQEKDMLLKEKEACEIQKASLVKLLEGSRKDTKEREKQVILWLISLSGVRMLIL